MVGDPYQFWKGYYEKNSNESPEQLLETVVQILAAKDVQDPSSFLRVHGHAEAAIKAYLTVHPKAAEPWMYEWLVKAFEARKASEKDIRQALGYAAALARRTRNANDLVRVADMLVMRKIDGTIGEGAMQTSTGELIDLAGEVVPTNAVPPMMSINLALRSKDPKRMTDATDKLLSLGWPGLDDQLRKDARKQVEVLAKQLREDGRTDEAEGMLSHWPETESRDLFLRLTWSGEADIDLKVTEPLGAVASYANPRTVFGGAIIKNGYGKHPEEVYVCPRAFPGDYVATVEVIFNDEAKPVTEVNLEVIRHEGLPDESKENHVIKLADPKPITIHLNSGRRKVVLPYMAPPERPSIEPRPREAVAPGRPSPGGASAKPATPPATRSTPPAIRP